MACTEYKHALSGAAASGGELEPALRAHLQSCAACSEYFAAEQALFSAIDAGLQAAVNVAVPPSLLPRVRGRLAEEAAPRRGRKPAFALAAAAAALALTVFVVTRGNRDVPNPPPAKSSAITNEEPSRALLPNEMASTNHARVPSGLQRIRSRQRLAPASRAAIREPKVIVPAEEREAFALFVAAVQRDTRLAMALVTPPPERKEAPLSLEPLHMDELKVKPLDGTEAAESEELTR